MLEYRNRIHGGVVKRHTPDEWLEASPRWERLDESAPELKLEPDDNERTASE